MGKKNEAKKEKSTIIDPDENKITKKKKKSKKTKKEKKRAKKEKRSKVKELENEEQSKDLKNSTDQRMLLTDALNKANKKNEENTNDLDTAMAERQLMVDILKKVNKKHKKNKKNKKKKKKSRIEQYSNDSNTTPESEMEQEDVYEEEYPEEEYSQNEYEQDFEEDEPETEPQAYSFDPLSYNSSVSTNPNSLQKQQQHTYHGELLTHTYYTLPDDTKKFWKRRYQLFSKFDEGIYMSSELWFSVTPEKTAKYIAELFKSLLPSATKCCDVACGGGGNAIQFASLFDYVVAIDINPINLYCTQHNSEIYGVQDHIMTLEGDWNELSQDDSWIPKEITSSENVYNEEEENDDIQDWSIEEEDLDDGESDHVEGLEDIGEGINDDNDGGGENPWSGNGVGHGDSIWSGIREEDKPFDFIFSSPPWGGVDYLRDGFDLENMPSFPLTKMLTQFKQFTNCIGLYLPKLSDLDQLDLATRTVFGENAEYRFVHLGCAILALIGEELISNFDESAD